MYRSRAASILLLVAGLLLGLAAQAQPPGTMGSEAQAQGPWLGVTARDMAFDRLASLGLELGVEVVDVARDSPASEAGLRPGDILVELDGSPVYSVERLRWLVGRARTDAQLPLTYLRNGMRATAAVRLAARPAVAPPGTPPGTPWHRSPQPPSRSYLGVQLQPMTDELRQAFGASADRGVLIAQVVEGGPAAQAGLQAGDVLVRMERKPIRTVEDIQSVLGFYDPGTEIEVGVVRRQENRTLMVTLAEPPAAVQQQQGWPQWRQPPNMPVPIPDPGYFQTPMNQFFQRWQDLWRQGPQGGPGAVAQPAPGQSL
jgi:S1-C subfamily serine protease